MKVRGQWYATGVLAAVHGLLLFAALNLGVAWFLRAHPVDPVTLSFGEKPFQLVYPGWSREDLHQLLLETWSRPFAFEPFTDGKEPPYRGKFVNVDAAGFRRSRGGSPWPPDRGALSVFVFGGSTTFGYGVADDETVVSALQAWLAERLTARPVRCYNFGRGAYYSSQERALFEELLEADSVPDAAVFIDGLNEFVYDNPQLTGELRQFVRFPVRASVATLWHALPLRQLVSRLKFRTGLRPAPSNVEKYDDPGRLERQIERYLANRRMLRESAADRGVLPLFVWQPIPTYKYDLRHHLFGTYDFGLNYYSGFGYRRLEPRRKELSGPDAVWAADIQEGVREPLYVDDIHYTAAMSRRLAETIGQALLERGILADGIQR